MAKKTTAIPGMAGKRLVTTASLYVGPPKDWSEERIRQRLARLDEIVAQWPGKVARIAKVYGREGVRPMEAKREELETERQILQHRLEALAAEEKIRAKVNARAQRGQR